jgi:hypothetical protein
MCGGISSDELETIIAQLPLFVRNPVNGALGLKLLKAINAQKNKRRICNYLKLSGKFADKVNSTIGNIVVYGSGRTPITVESPEMYGALLLNLLANPDIKFQELPIVVADTPQIKYGRKHYSREDTQLMCCDAIRKTRPLVQHFFEEVRMGKFLASSLTETAIFSNTQERILANMAKYMVDVAITLK